MPAINCLFFACLMTYSCTLLAADSITKNITLSAHVDNEGFYSYKVTKFGFGQPFLSVEYNAEKKEFESQSTDLIVETDIPVGFNAGFEIVATEMSSICESATGNVVEDGFASYYLDGKLLKLDSPVYFESFNNSDSFYLNDKRDFSVVFSPTPNLDIWKSRCSGTASVAIGLSF